MGKVFKVEVVNEFYLYDEENKVITFKPGQVCYLDTKGPGAGWPMLEVADGYWYDVCCESDEAEYEFKAEDGEVYLRRVINKEFSKQSLLNLINSEKALEENYGNMYLKDILERIKEEYEEELRIGVYFGFDINEYVDYVITMCEG